jgi:molybdopterin converting factor subunit 1
VKVRVLLFASLRERAGTGTLDLELRDGGTIGDALEEMAQRPELAEAMRRMPIATAVNREYAAKETALADGDELALIPPISGGAGLHVRVTGEPLSADALSRLVGDPGAGAIVCFQGVTRSVAMLDYEAYREMAEARIEAIAGECIDRHSLLGVAAEHRVGQVPLGEPAVVVAVSAAHRAEAFAGAREVIDRIKAEAPIWKREIPSGEEGEWVEGVPPRATGGEEP